MGMIISLWFIFQDVNTPTVTPLCLWSLLEEFSAISVHPNDGKHTFYNVLFQRKWDTGYPCLSCLILLNCYRQSRAVTHISSTRKPHSPSFRRGGQARTHTLDLWASSRPRSTEPYLISLQVELIYLYTLYT